MGSQKIALKVILIILCIAGLCLYMFLGSVSAEVKNGSIVVNGTLTSETDILYTDIEECLLYDSIDTGMPSVAFQNFKVKTGRFSSSQYGPYQLMIYNNVQKFIIIKANDSYTIFNCKTEEETTQCFNEIQTAINNLVADPEQETETLPDTTPEIDPEPTPDIGGEAPN